MSWLLFPVTQIILQSWVLFTPFKKLLHSPSLVLQQNSLHTSSCFTFILFTSVFLPRASVSETLRQKINTQSFILKYKHRSLKHHQHYVQNSCTFFLKMFPKGESLSFFQYSIQSHRGITETHWLYEISITPARCLSRPTLPYYASDSLLIGKQYLSFFFIFLLPFFISIPNETFWPAVTL